MIVPTENELLGLILAFVGIFPSILLLKLYFQTKITDYLLFGLFFLDGIMVLVLDPIAGITNNLIFFQLHHLSIDFAFLLLFIHACRMTWKRIPRSVLFIGFSYYLILLFMTLLWQNFTQPEFANVIFINLPHSFSSYFPEGAGLKYNGIIIYSTAFRYIGEFFRIFSLIFLFNAYYFKSRPYLIESDNKIVRARQIWLLIWSLFLLHTLSLIFFPYSLVSIFLVIAAVLIFYITFFLPEGLLISSVQLTRILPLYSFILKQTEKNPHNTTIESISTYLTILNNLDEYED